VYHPRFAKRLIVKVLSVALTRQDVAHIAHLARLAVSADEEAEYVSKLSRIIELVDQLKQVDTRGVAPMAHPLDMAQRLRPDEITESDQRELVQQNAPRAEEGLYLVPRVIE
jgi:aspartyl-tRNA(Asn)/glutamyl-tRNA(Gln) amidotransferase subunit C